MFIYCFYVVLYLQLYKSFYKLEAVMHWIMHSQRILKSNSPPSVNVTLFEDRVLADDHVTMRSLEWTLTWHDNVLTKKGGVGHKTDMQREDDVETWKTVMWWWRQRLDNASTSHKLPKIANKPPEAWSRSFPHGSQKEINLVSTLILDFWPLEMWQ